MSINYGQEKFAKSASKFSYDDTNDKVDASAKVNLALNTGLTPGSGISGSANTVYKSWCEEFGGITKTCVLMDLTDLACGDGANDIIGDDGGVANSHIGQYDENIMGTLFMVKLDVLEAPTGGDPDINLCFADEATLAENAALSSGTNTGTTLNNGDLAAGAVHYAHSGFAAKNQYWYLSNGTATENAYTAGAILITFYGTTL